MILLFYKRLLEPGGAERLLINQYLELKKLGYEVKIMSRSIAPHDFFQDIEDEHLILLGNNPFIACLKAMFIMIRTPSVKIICSSGHMDIFLYTFFGFKNYYLQIHHPAFMSFNDFDKYCFFYKKKFNVFTKSNFGAKVFLDIKASLPLLQKALINIRGLLSLIALKCAKKIFVLSELAKNEKKQFFGLDTIVEKGAIHESLLSYQPEVLKEFDKFEFKFFTLARLDINKRIDVLIDAFSLFLKEHPSSALVIGGQGSELESLKAQAVRKGIQENVIFKGFIPDEEVFSYYSMADIFVSIDWADYRITSYEALAMGTRVILSNETDNDVFLEESMYLKLVEPTAASTSHAMFELLQNKTMITDNQLNEYLKNYTWSTYTQNILNHMGLKIA